MGCPLTLLGHGQMPQALPGPRWAEKHPCVLQSAPRPPEPGLQSLVLAGSVSLLKPGLQSDLVVAWPVAGALNAHVLPLCLALHTKSPLSGRKPPGLLRPGFLSPGPALCSCLPPSWLCPAPKSFLNRHIVAWWFHPQSISGSRSQSRLPVGHRPGDQALLFGGEDPPVAFLSRATQVAEICRKDEVW